MITSGLFVGTIRHRRFAPVSHHFTYPGFMALLDVDTIPTLMRASRLTSWNRWNWASFDDRDHFGDPARPLRERVEDEAKLAGIDPPGGPMFLLTHLRYLGYCFNPVSFFYLCDRNEQLRIVLAEVHNTFGGAHNYWLMPHGHSQTFRSVATKSMYVSPFMPADVEYRFALTCPDRRLAVHIEATREGQRLLDATLRLERRPWTAREIRRQLVRFPAMTALVTAGIHWEAIKLWWKDVPLVPHTRSDRATEVRRAG